jgi:hypothetical protein
MFEGIMRIVLVAAGCASASWVLRRLLQACGCYKEIESEIELDDILKRLEGHPEGGSSNGWQFEKTGLVVTTNIETA